MNGGLPCVRSSVQEPHGDWFDRVPKVELHVHLEGAIPCGALWELVRKYGGDPSVPDIDALTGRFVYRDFSQFIDTWVWKNGFLREYDDFTFVAEAVARDLAAQGLRYVEAFYSPPDFIRHGLEPQPLTEAWRTGLARVPEVEIALIADVVRNSPPESALKTVAAVSELKALGVVGIGLGGSEQRFPPAPFAPAYALARRNGLRTTAHAGEAAGADSIWSALRDLQAERLGHGTRAHEDPRLIDHLLERQIPLEMCPISNVRTGVVPTIDEHPVRDYARRGLLVTVNTDDPAMFNTSLAGEYRLLVSRLGFSADDIRAFVLAAVQASWLPDDRKDALRSAIVSDPAWADA